MATNIKDRLKAKLKKSKRTLNLDETKQLQKLLTEYPDTPKTVQKQVQLLKETDDKNLVDAIFAKIESDFGSDFLAKESATFVYQLQDTVLKKKFEDYVVGQLKSGELSWIISMVASIADDDLLKKTAENLPLDASIINKFLIRIPKKFVDVAIEQFSKPQYTFLPLLTLLETKCSGNLLSYDQVTRILDTVTVAGLLERKKICPVYASDIDYLVMPRVAQKLSDLKGYDWERYVLNMPLDFLVLLLLSSKESKLKKIGALIENTYYKNGSERGQGIKYFINSVNQMGLEFQLNVQPKYIKTSEFFIK